MGDAAGAHTESEQSPSADGFTFVEVLVTIVLMGTMVLAVLTAVQANIVASSTSRSASRTESVIVNLADRINRAPKSCDYTIYAQAAVLTEQWPASSVTVDQWRLDYGGYSGNAVDSGDWLLGGCESGLTAPPDLLVQKVRISVTSPDGKVTRYIELVKSDV